MLSDRLRNRDGMGLIVKAVPIALHNQTTIKNRTTILSMENREERGVTVRIRVKILIVNDGRAGSDAEHQQQEQKQQATHFEQGIIHISRVVHAHRFFPYPPTQKRAPQDRKNHTPPPSTSYH